VSVGRPFGGVRPAAAGDVVEDDPLQAVVVADDPALPSRPVAQRVARERPGALDGVLHRP